MNNAEKYNTTGNNIEWMIKALYRTVDGLVAEYVKENLKAINYIKEDFKKSTLSPDVLYIIPPALQKVFLLKYLETNKAESWRKNVWVNPNLDRSLGGSDNIYYISTEDYKMSFILNIDKNYE